MENGESTAQAAIRETREEAGAEVAVAVSRSAGDASLTVLDGATRTFKSANWSSWQTVTLAAPADDADVDGETTTFQVSMNGAADQFVEATALDELEHPAHHRVRFTVAER